MKRQSQSQKGSRNFTVIHFVYTCPTGSPQLNVSNEDLQRAGGIGRAGVHKRRRSTENCFVFHFKVVIIVIIYVQMFISQNKFVLICCYVL